MSATLTAEPATATDSMELQAIPAGIMLERAKLNPSPTEKKSARRAELELLARLRELGLYVYPSELVAAHKEHMLASLVHRYKRQQQALIALGIIATITYAAFAFTSMGSELTSCLWVIPFFLFLSAGVHRHWSKQVFWQTRTLEQYKAHWFKRLPDAVVALEELVKSHWPDVTFSIDYLKTDPVLYVHKGPNIYQQGSCCIAVWRKPGRRQPLLGQ